KLEVYQNEEVKKAIGRASKILTGEIYELHSGGFLKMISGYFEDACQAVGYFQQENIEDWLKIKLMKEAYNVVATEGTSVNQKDFALLSKLRKLNKTIYSYTRDGQKATK